MSDAGSGANGGGLPPPPPPGSNPPPPPPGQGQPPPPPGGSPGGWSPPPDTSRHVPGGHILADPWPRIGARLIDGIIVGIVNLVLTLPFADVSGTGTSFSASVSGVGILVGLIVGAAYEIGFVGTQGAT
ncbi:MAG: RDD family protein, partial [Actinomycetota bacterium]